MRVLLLSQTTGYQTRAFGAAARRLGIETIFATDRCDHLEDPWRDRAIPIRFHDQSASVDAIVRAVGDEGVAGVLALGDRPTVIAAEVALALGVTWHPPYAARAARDKHLTRTHLAAAGLHVPWSTMVTIDADPRSLARELRWPLVIKPTVLSGSRGVIRADTPDEFVVAFERLRRLLESHDVRALRDPGSRHVHIEGYIDGRELALEGLLDRGVLRTLALFDKPDPLEGPFFEETIYVTPSRLPSAEQVAIRETVAAATRALGLWHGPIHAECRVAQDGVYVLEVAARPIGGHCAKALSFVAPDGGSASLEELLLAHAAGRAVGQWPREQDASGVMMIPIPRAGIYRGVHNLEIASAVDHVTGVHISAKPDQRLVPLPEGASYLGFIFARAEAPALVEAALREAHALLQFEVDVKMPVLES
jgi:biotin carboxylase